ncbi:MAG: inosine monophosphate cyclohydrolase [Firmicutes bacterium]|nr:inosine monophosphate cyclohydrolase [Bacillota bacterium]
MDLEKIALLNEENLKNNPYPGRGIIIGISPDRQNYVQVYWIMGRSNNSRNRVFVQEGSFMRTKAFDESKVEDPSLIIYYPIKDLNGYYIVSNGDQTDTIYNYLMQQKTFEAALKTREFEPDAPHYTPRISGLIDLNGEPSYALSILKTENHNPDYCLRAFYYYDKYTAGYGHCIHTYEGDGNPLPSFAGEPKLVRVFDDIDQTARYYWELLNEENRVALAVKFINCKDRSASMRIINKHN